MADDSWYDTLAKKGYLGDAAKIGASTGRASWEPHSDQKMQDYHNEFDAYHKNSDTERHNNVIDEANSVMDRYGK